MRALAAIGALVLACAVGLAGGNSSLAGEAPRSADVPQLFDAGPAVDGLPLTAVLRREDTGSVSFVYGDCSPGDEAGCAAPAEVQVWPACRRSLASYERDARSPTPERTVVRGVPAGFFDGGMRLEIQTGSATVVVFGDSRARAARVAAALASVDGAVSPGQPLPPPVDGAVEGRLDC